MYSQITSNKRRTWLLVAVFATLILGIGYTIGRITDTPPAFTLGLAAIISIVMALVSYFKGDAIALAAAGAVAVTREQNPYVYRMVENLTITAGLKKIPDIYLIDDSAINAFATGRDPAHASIAITRGAIERLENEELEGVIAHELSHITNYDIRIMTIVIVLVGVVALLADMMRFSRFTRRSSNRENGTDVFAIIGIVLIILSPIFAQLIQLAISRRREYLADASGALLTRYPAGLANALEKIRDTNEPMRHRNSATAHLYLDSPFRSASSGSRVANLFSTHPPIDDRIRALREMAH